MRLDWLRARLLLALGVTVGCGAKPPQIEEPDEPEADAPVATPAPGPKYVTSIRQEVEQESTHVPTVQRRAECALQRDTVFETACLEWGGRDCEIHPRDDHEDEQASELYVTEPRYHGLEHFLLEREATKRYQAKHESGCCYTSCTAMRVSTEQVPQPSKSRFEPAHVAIPRPPGGTSAPSKIDARCANTLRIKGELRPLSHYDAAQDRCMYWGLRFVPSGTGRPARVDGAARVGDLATGVGWHAEVPALAADPEAAATWTRTAQLEHASIAAFSNLALQLLAHGAPAELIEATHAAALDELRHARIAFAIASQYAGVAVGPAAFPEAARMSAEVTLRALALETFVDGCIGEACGAAEAYRAAHGALAPILHAIAEDEARHAALAWGVVRWCVAQEPAILDALHALLGRADGDPEILAITGECLAAISA
ncbi:MAG: ferritin-like domain-containing protein [Kofleriaceae bacterium]